MPRCPSTLGAMLHRFPHRIPSVLDRRTKYQHPSDPRDGVSLVYPQLIIFGFVHRFETGAFRWLQR